MKVLTWLLRKMYSISWWLCDRAAPPEAPVFKGFYTRFKKPEDLKDEEVGPELEKLLKEALKD